ncbi:hypothetical protein BGS_0549 [Beggiatoa sp. SS]|nr:hypothetical protein BGS_0549 [Beggiatoa sp. SS]
MDIVASFYEQNVAIPEKRRFSKRILFAKCDGLKHHIYK